MKLIKESKSIVLLLILVCQHVLMIKSKLKCINTKKNKVNLLSFKKKANSANIRRKLYYSRYKDIKRRKIYTLKKLRRGSSPSVKIDNQEENKEESKEKVDTNTTTLGAKMHKVYLTRKPKPFDTSEEPKKLNKYSSKLEVALQAGLKSEKNEETKSRGFLASFKKVFNEAFNSKNIKAFVNFTLGFLSVYVHTFKEVYEKLKTLKEIYDLFSTCYVKADELERDKDLQKQFESNTVLSYFKNIKDADEKQKFCEYIKTKNHKALKDNCKIKSSESSSSFNSYICSLLGIFGTESEKPNDMTTDEYCQGYKDIFIKDASINMAGESKILNKSKSQILKEYESYEEFEVQCKFFAELDCEAFSKFEGKSVVKTIGTALGFSNFKVAVADCLSNVVKEKIMDSAVSLLWTQIQTYAGTVLNIITVGVWGLIKGTYHIIMLGYKIYQFIDGEDEDQEFKVGIIIGHALKIATSLLLGARKKIRKFNK